MEILKLCAENLADINKANEPFDIVGCIKPYFVNNAWGYTEELYDIPYTKTYPSEDCDYSEYVDAPDKAVFLAYSEDACIGQIILRKDWNKYAFIEDICVAGASRGKGVGSSLIRKAAEWAIEKGLNGLALETQNNNLLACRFYAKCGFSIGAVNTMLYRNFDKPWSDEIAVSWYLTF